MESNIKISALNPASPLTGREMIPAVQDGFPVKVYVSNVPIYGDNVIEKYTNEINVDILYPLSEGYYTLQTAIAAIVNTSLKKTGIKLAFEDSANHWVSYQFIGSDIAGWNTESNWKPNNTVQTMNSILATMMLQYDYSDIIELNSGNFYINSSGINVANNDCRVSDFVDCSKAKYFLPYFYCYMSAYCAYYDSNKSFIPGSAFQVDNTKFGTIFNVPANAVYIKVSAFVSGTDYKNDFPIGLLVGNQKDNFLSVIQKSDVSNVKINGAICSLQRWGSVAGQYLKIKFPDSVTGLSNGISYVFDLTIRKLELNTASKNYYLKLRVEFLRSSVTQYIPNISYVAGNASLIDNVKLYYEMDGGNAFQIPSVIINSDTSLLGIVVDNMNIAAHDNSVLTATELSAFTLTEETSIDGLTLINDYSDILLTDNLPITKSQSEQLFISIDNIPSKSYDYTIYSELVDPETGENNSFYRTIYKRKVSGESRIIAKVWSSSAGQKIFRAFDVNGNIISSYSRDTQTGENDVILTLNIILGSDVASYSISYVQYTATPDASNASLTLYYDNIGKYIDKNVQPQLDTINTKISNGYKYIDIKGVSKSLSKFRSLINTPHSTPLNLLFVGDSIVNFQNAWNIGETPTYYDKPLCMYNPNTFTTRIWQLLNTGALYYDNTIKNYSGGMTFLKTNPIPGDLTPTSGVVISGTWLSNITGSAYNNLGDCGGYPNTGWHEFLFSKTQNDYMEFNIPIGSIGFSVVAECSTTSRSSDGTNYYLHSSAVQIYLDGTLLDTINMADKNGNIRFDFTIGSPLTKAGTVKILLTESNKWVGIWGVETWNTQYAVRPINNGLASHSIKAVFQKYERAISSANPDCIIFCGMLNNDSTLLESEVRNYYELMWNNLASLDKPIIGISTHWGTYNRMYYNPEDMNHDDPRNADPYKGYHPAYLRIFTNWCREHEIPLINPCQYMYDNYGDDSSPFLVDVAHLNVNGHNLYKGLINAAFIGDY